MSPSLDQRQLRAARRRSARGLRRGMTLIETLITLTIIALISGIAILGLGASSSAKLKAAAAQLVGSIRIAYAHSISTSKVVRLVFDFSTRKTTMEETPAHHLIRKDLSGGANPATELESAALEASQTIAQGPQAPRASFQDAEEYGMPAKDGRDLPQGISFWSVHSSHDDKPINDGHAYLYFFPNGQTEAAAIQLRVTRSDEADNTNFLTVLVSPLTGRAEVKGGRVDIEPPRNDNDMTERTEP